MVSPHPTDQYLTFWVVHQRRLTPPVVCTQCLQERGRPPPHRSVPYLLGGPPIASHSPCSLYTVSNEGGRSPPHRSDLTFWVVHQWRLTPPVVCTQCLQERGRPPPHRSVPYLLGGPPMVSHSPCSPYTVSSGGWLPPTPQISTLPSGWSTNGVSLPL